MPARLVEGTRLDPLLGPLELLSFPFGRHGLHRRARLRLQCLHCGKDLFTEAASPDGLHGLLDQRVQQGNNRARIRARHVDAEDHRVMIPPNLVGRWPHPSEDEVRPVLPEEPADGAGHRVRRGTGGPITRGDQTADGPQVQFALDLREDRIGRPQAFDVVRPCGMLAVSRHLHRCRIVGGGFHGVRAGSGFWMDPVTPPSWPR